MKITAKHPAECCKETQLRATSCRTASLWSPLSLFRFRPIRGPHSVHQLRLANRLADRFQDELRPAQPVLFAMGVNGRFDRLGHSQVDWLGFCHSHLILHWGGVCHHFSSTSSAGRSRCSFASILRRACLAAIFLFTVSTAMCKSIQSCSSQGSDSNLSMSFSSVRLRRVSAGCDLFTSFL